MRECVATRVGRKSQGRAGGDGAPHGAAQGACRANSAVGARRLRPLGSAERRRGMCLAESSDGAGRTASLNRPKAEGGVVASPGRGMQLWTPRGSGFGAGLAPSPPGLPSGTGEGPLLPAGEQVTVCPREGRGPAVPAAG